MDRHFPYEYGTSLHWLWGWGQRLHDAETMVTEPSRLAGMYFRPCNLAANAIAEFSVEFSAIVRQIQDYLDHAEKCFARFLESESEGDWTDFCIAAGDLKDRIFKGCQVIHATRTARADRSSVGEDRVMTLAGDTVLRNELTEESRTSGEWADIFDWEGGRKTFNDKMNSGKIRVVRDPKSSDGSPRYFMHVDDITASKDNDIPLLRSSKIARDQKVKKAKKPGRGGARKAKA